MRGQREVVCHGGLFDGKRIAYSGPYPRDRIEMMVPEQPQLVTESPPLRTDIIFVRCVYVLARTYGGRQEFVYVPEDFYVVRD